MNARNKGSARPSDEGATGRYLRAELLDGAPLTERRIDLAGVSTAVLEAGGGPPVVLIHGQGNFGAAFLPLLVPLASTHRVIAPDLPGLGASEMTDREPDGPTVMAWLSELIDKTCDAPPALVGMSLGGSIAARYAVEHSDRISRLVLINSGSLGPRPPLRVLLPLIRHSARPSEKTAKRMMSIVMQHPERGPQVLGARFGPFQAYMLDRARTPSVQRANRRLLRELGFPRIPDGDLAWIKAPTTLICGRHDRVMKLGYAEQAARRHHWQLEVIDDAGHVVFVDQQEATLTALRRALER